MPAMRTLSRLFIVILFPRETIYTRSGGTFRDEPLANALLSLVPNLIRF
jgi:hypothetical protein